MVNATVGSALFDSQFLNEHPSSEMHFRSFNDISNMYDVSCWMRHALPAFLFEGADGGGIDTPPTHAVFGGNTTSCLITWNCLITGYNGSSALKMARISQRLYKRVPNVGLLSLDPDT